MTKLRMIFNRNRHTDIENRFVVARVDRVGEGMDWEFGISRCKLVYRGWINHKVPLYT